MTSHLSRTRSDRSEAAVSRGAAECATPDGRRASMRDDGAGRASRNSGGRVVELQEITAAVLTAVPGAAYASVTRATGDGRIHGHGASDPIVESLVLFQKRARQGPYNVAREGRTVTIADIRRDDRWPRFHAAAADVGIAGMLTVGVPTDDGAQAALTLYATKPDAFTEDDETIAGVFAVRAGGALADATDRRQVIDLVSENGVVGRATGMLIYWYDVSPAGACNLLAEAAAHTGRTVTAVANELADLSGTGNLIDRLGLVEELQA